MITELTLKPERNFLIVALVEEYLLESRKILILTDRRGHCEKLLELLIQKNTFNYVTNQNIHVKIKNKWNPDWHPDWILTNNIKLIAAKAPSADKPAPLIYTIEANLISVLSSYPDLNYSFPLID